MEEGEIIVMEANYKNDVEIDLIDLMWSILNQWKILLLAGVIGVALGAGYKVYSNHTTNQRAVAESEESDAVSIEERISSLQDNLSEQELANVDFAVTYQTKLEEKERYEAESIYMNLNPDAVACVSLIYMIDNGYTFNYTETVLPNNAAALQYAYADYIDNGMLVSDISDALPNIEPSDLQELVSTSQRSDANAIEMVSLKVYGKDAQQARMIADEVERVIGIYSNLVQKEIGKHELTLVNTSESIVSDQDLAAAQDALDAALIDYRTKIVNYKQAFSDEQNQLYDLLIDKAETDKGLFKENITDDTKEDSETVGSGSIMSGVPKFGILGGVAGVFLVCIIIVCIYLFNGYVKTGDEFASLFGLYLLGDYSEITDGKSRLERFKHKQKWTVDEKRKLTVANIKVLCHKYGITRIYLASTLHVDAGLRKEIAYIVNELQANGIEATWGENVLHDAGATEKMSSYEYAILVEKINTSRYADIAQLLSARSEQKNKLLGVIVL